MKRIRAFLAVVVSLFWSAWHAVYDYFTPLPEEYQGCQLWEVGEVMGTGWRNVGPPAPYDEAAHRFQEKARQNPHIRYTLRRYRR